MGDGVKAAEGVGQGMGIAHIGAGEGFTGGMGGKETVGKVQEIDPEATVIVASGYSQDPVMANYGEYGFSAAITKPFEISELQAAIERVRR